MACFSVLTILCGLAPTFWWLLTARFATGVAAAIGSPQIWAIIPTLVPREKIASTMSAPTAGLTIATLLGIPLGSSLAAGNAHLPFFAVGSAAILVTIGVALFFPQVALSSHGSDATKRPGILGTYAVVLGGRKAQGYFTAYLIFQLGNFAVMTFIAKRVRHSHVLMGSAPGLVDTCFLCWSVCVPMFLSMVSYSMGVSFPRRRWRLLQ